MILPSIKSGVKGYNLGENHLTFVAKDTILDLIAKIVRNLEKHVNTSIFVLKSYL